MYIITIDSGTTNSRIRLVSEESSRIIDFIKKQVGVKNTAIEGNTDMLQSQLSEGIQELLERNHCKPEDIKYIIATGMITSNLGLFEVPHIEGPASIEDFAKASSIQVFEGFFHIPCIFVPGMKNGVTDEQGTLHEMINQYDVMRGEEVETFGLLHQLELKGKGMFILPGSHTKCVFVNDGKIQSSLSTLCGEMLSALSQNTILSSSLSDNLVTSIDERYLLEGYHSSEKYGLTRTLFHIRLLDLFEAIDENQRANYLVGALIFSDIVAIQEIYRFDEVDWLVIGGGSSLRKAFVTTLHHKNIGNVIEATSEQVEHSTVVGACEIGSSFYKNS